MLQLLSCIASVVIFFGFVNIYVVRKLGVPRSISITAYWLEKDWLYTAAMTGAAITLAIAGGTWLTGIAAILLVVTAFANEYRKNLLTHWLHIGGAYGAIIIGLLSLGLDFGLWWMAGIGGALIFALWIPQVRNHTYWIENAAYYIIWTGIFIQYI